MPKKTRSRAPSVTAVYPFRGGLSTLEQIGLQEISSKNVKFVYNTQCIWMSFEEAWTTVKAPEVELVE